MKIITKKSTLFSIVLISIIVFAPLAFAAKPQAKKQQDTHGQPSIQVKELTYNFGEILEGNQVEHQFTMKNVGTAVLNIARVRVD